LFTFDSDSGHIGLGSGFFIDREGHVATNWHVVDEADIIFAKMIDGKILKVKGVIAKNIEADLAIIKIDLKGYYCQPLPIAREVPSIGEDILVIGNPKGLESTVSKGIVSAIREPEAHKEIQIDAATSKGSSGGPVINKDGEVVGVVAWGRTDGQQLNFAISSEELLELLGGVNIFPLEGPLYVEACITEDVFDVDALCDEIFRPFENRERLIARLKEREDIQDANQLYDYFKQAYMGDMDASYMLALCYQKGYLLKKDYKKAHIWYRKAARGGDSNAMLQIAFMINLGQGVTADIARSLHWYKKSANACKRRSKIVPSGGRLKSVPL